MVLSSSPRSSSLQFSRPANCILVCLDSGLPDQRRRRQRARRRRWASWSLDCIKILPVWHTHTHTRALAGALAGISQGDLGFGSGGVRATDHYLLSTERREGITWPPGASGGLRPEWVSIPGPFLSLCPWQRDGQPRSLNACRNSPLYFILGQPRGARGGPAGTGAGFLQATSSALSHHRLGRVCFGGRRDSEGLLRREPVSCRRQLERVTAFTFSVWKCLWMKCLGHRCHSSEHEGELRKTLNGLFWCFRNWPVC